MPVNIKIEDANFSLGPEEGFFYTIDVSAQILLQVEADGTVAATFPLLNSTIRTTLYELHFDGTFFWTLEDLPSNLGIVIKKWRLSPFKTFSLPNVVPTTLRWADELSLINQPNIRYKSKAFCVEHYHLTLASSALRGDKFVVVNDSSKVRAGDIVYLGPSSFGGFQDFEEQAIVSAVNGNQIHFSNPQGIENSYISGDPLDLHKNLFVFNDHGFSGQADERGCILKYSLPQKTLIGSDQKGKYNKVSAADFDLGSVGFIKTFQFMTIDLSDPLFSINSSSEVGLVKPDLTSNVEVFDLIIDFNADLIFKLQNEEVTEDIPTGSLGLETFGNQFNFQTFPLLPKINSVALGFDKRIIRPLPSSDRIDVSATLTDQFNFPVSLRDVQFSASIMPGFTGTPGTFTSTIVQTNASGIATTRYVPSSDTKVLPVLIQAKVL